MTGSSVEESKKRAGLESTTSRDSNSGRLKHNMCLRTFFHFINNTFKYNILCGGGKVAQWVSLLPQIKKVPGSKPGGLSVWSLYVLSVLALGCFPFPHNLKTWRVGHPPLTSSWDIGIGFSIPASLQYDKWYENGWKDALLTNLDYFTNLEVPLEPEGNIYVMISWMS